ncbi:hypothetical protein FNE15_06490 [Helicobacter pylori]|uniref:hypothetical protein n=1 Tax=Helicobacter pylori TaxID=210 RepID=UPI0015E7E4E6|nr:hypothetical protein [Helicobacter pylori]MBH0256598.1 hypothetical protein [Helicobacter pylori]MBH0286183.1 hypothetical protein [Helicobacter pylori]MBH0298079.1 hypothetical protein [Helicobacter pylori]WQT20423.1 hypothetical protein E5A86_06855 [Helicobacter pylori]WQU01252.1 hypothetical protein KVD03_06770 [Helicobacter pylori]
MHELVLRSQALGFETRLVQCDLSFSYERFISKTKRSLAVLEEFDWLNSGFDFSRLNVENDTLELLKALYFKLEKLESLLLKENLLELEQNNRIIALGHGLVCLKKQSLIAPQTYYGRCVLEGKILAFFGVARGKDFLEITRMHALDTKRYDSFIVDSERKGLKL